MIVQHNFRESPNLLSEWEAHGFVKFGSFWNQYLVKVFVNVSCDTNLLLSASIGLF